MQRMDRVQDYLVESREVRQRAIDDPVFSRAIREIAEVAAKALAGIGWGRFFASSPWQTMAKDATFSNSAKLIPGKCRASGPPITKVSMVPHCFAVATGVAAPHLSAILGSIAGPFSQPEAPLVATVDEVFQLLFYFLYRFETPCQIRCFAC